MCEDLYQVLLVGCFGVLAGYIHGLFIAKGSKSDGSIFDN